MVHVNGTSVSGPIERGCSVFQQYAVMEWGVIGVLVENERVVASRLIVTCTRS
jgi:hypothetical protein